MRRALTILLLGATALTACSSDGTSGSTATSGGTTDTSAPDTTTSDTITPDTTAPATTTPETTAAPITPDPTRPFTLFTPTSYQDGTPMPLVILLHGYGASGDIQEAYFQVQPLAEEKGFLYVHPDGTKNQLGQQFWNATDACCNFAGTVDDVQYITGIIDQVSAERDVDPKRIYLMGHSNGGFMSYRMACDLAGRVAAIASLAGATFDDPTKCAPDEPVSVLQVHGTADGTIAYAGGTIPVVNATFPGAVKTVTTWAGYDGCDTTPTSTGEAFDIETNLAGDETTVQEFGGCPTGIAVQLWTVEGGAHIPGITFPDGSHPLTERMVDFLLAHPKP